MCVGSLVKCADKLSTTGYGVEANGELTPVPSHQKLKMHEQKDQHIYNVNMKKVQQAKATGQPSPAGGSMKPLLTITSEEELCAPPYPPCTASPHSRHTRHPAHPAHPLPRTPAHHPSSGADARTIRTIHVVAKCQLSLTATNHLLELQNANGLVMSFDHVAQTGADDGGLGTWLLAGARVFQKRLRARATPPVITNLFPSGVLCGLMGDGSNDRSMAEQEAVVLRFIGADAKPFNAFYELAPLDLSTSQDGRSPDAACITECYSNSLDKLDAHEGFLFGSSWRKALVGVSFDGASVMLGSQNGVAAKLERS